MAAPCINTTCSVDANIDPVTRRLELDVINSNYGSVKCNAGGEPSLSGGLYVDIANNTPLALSADNKLHNTLVRNSDGKLYAALPHGDLTRVAGDYVGIPHTYNSGTADPYDGDVSANSVNFTVTNYLPYDALLLLFCDFVLNYQVTTTPGNSGNGVVCGEILATSLASGPVPPAAKLIPFNLNVAAQLFFGTNSRMTARFDSSGIAPYDGQYKKVKEYAASAYQMSAGEVIAITSSAFHDGLSQRLNINTAPVTGGGSSIGFRTIVQYALVPLGMNVTNDGDV